MSDGPQDPFIPQGLASAMKSMYELYASAVQAGFTQEQSMQIVVGVLTTHMKAALNKGTQE